MAKKNPSKEWSMPARVGVGAAVGYLLLGPVGGVGGAVAGSMYTLERNPGPGFLATGKQFGLNFPNGYSIAIGWNSGEAFGRFADISVTKPDGNVEGMSRGWGPGNMAKVIYDTSRRSRTVRGVLGMNKPKVKTLQILGIGIVSKGPNFSIIFENGWALRVDPDGPSGKSTSSNQYNFAPTATVFLYTPRGELAETIERVDPVSIARMFHSVATFKQKPPQPRRRKGNILPPVKGELKGNPRRKAKAASAEDLPHIHLQACRAGIDAWGDLTEGDSTATDKYALACLELGDKSMALIDKRREKNAIKRLGRDRRFIVKNHPNMPDYSFILKKGWEPVWVFWKGYYDGRVQLPTDRSLTILLGRSLGYKYYEIRGFFRRNLVFKKAVKPEAADEVFEASLRKTKAWTKRFYPDVYKLLFEGKSMQKELIEASRMSWEHYCERPSKKRLKAVLKHCELMAGSSAKSVKDERARCLRSAKQEAKKLGLKM